VNILEVNILQVWYGRVRALPLALLLGGFSAVTVAAQDAPGAKATLSFSGGALIYPGPIHDPSTATTWSLGSAFSAGLGLHSVEGRRVVAGVDVAFAPVVDFLYLTSFSASGPFRDGSARLASALASVRLYAVRRAAVSAYFSAGGGGFFWGIPKLRSISGGCLEDVEGCSEPIGGWDADLAFLAGAGLEHRGTGRPTIFLEVDRWQTFHQRARCTFQCSVETPDPPANNNAFIGMKLGVRIIR
jgi:hypothetical protein